MNKKYADGKKYIVRSYGAGVFFGEISERNGQEVAMKNARRLWRWEGATECIQIAVEGVKNPKNCKFTLYVDEIELLNVIEIIPCTDEAIKSIEGVSIWKI